MEDRPKKSYNVGAEMYRQGIIPMESEMNMDDMELVEELDLSPGLAYTPAINKAAAEAQRQRNIKNGMAEYIVAVCHLCHFLWSFRINQFLYIS